MRGPSVTLSAHFIIIAFLILAFEGARCQTNSSLLRFDSLVQAANESLYYDYDKSDSLFDLAGEIIVKHGVKNSPLKWITLLHHRANAARYNSKYSMAKNYLDDSFAALVTFRSVIAEKYDSLYFLSRHIEASYLYVLDHFDDALRNFIAVEQYIKSLPRKEGYCERLFQIVQYEAFIYLKKGEYESAINQYISSIQYYDCYRDTTKVPVYVLIYRNIAGAYWKIGDWSQAMLYAYRAKTNLNNVLKLRTYDSQVLGTYAVVLYDDIANYHIEKRALDSADYYYRLALPYIHENPNFANRIYLGMAKIAQQRNNKHALKLFMRALVISTSTFGEKNVNTARVYLEIANLYEQKKDFKMALEFIQKALNSVSGAQQLPMDSLNINPSLNFILSKKDALTLLNKKASLFYKLYSQRLSEIDLANARESNRLAIELLDSTRNEFTLEKDKVVLGEEAVRIYETSIEIAYELYEKNRKMEYLYECFALMDKSKSAVLLDHLKLVRNFSRIPPELLEKERQLKAELTVAEEELFKAETQKQETSKQRQILDDLKKAHAALFAEIKTFYPHYYHLRIQNNTFSLQDVQSKLLDPGQALVEYFIGDSSLYIVCITATKAWMRVSSSDALRDDVIELREMIISQDQNSLDRKANVIYDKLVVSWIDDLDPSVTSLVIIPHGILSHLPFEMLTGTNEREALLHHFTVSYASSASLLWEQKSMNVSGRSFAGFNADYTNHKRFPQLKGSVTEVQSIQELLGSGSRLFLNSTAEDFRNEAPQYRVLHLALHSFINDERPLFSRLVFTSSVSDSSEVTANDLYNMELNADMAVLSACESGIGQIHRGEGMMSLSRAFMYAGVPSTVISLWKVPDQATSLLMTKFYNFLKAGQSKDVALSNAKKEFIKDYPMMSAPLFWAGFVVNGKTDPVSLTAPTEAAFIIRVIVLMLAVILMVVLWRRYKHYQTSAG